jgi:hypothetical protein
MAMEIAIPLIAGLVIAVLCGLLLSLSFLARRRDMAVLGQHVCAMLDSEPGARLLLSADGRVIHANEAGGSCWALGRRRWQF